ncbi:AAA family ATPase [Amycolatopsis sp. NPDC051903]|uniref:helix-turn-helix transcriptional regulator n=1 Tax=Amycolatopsis sp. NPDC051903 TaxID=3363936 RepID=UPI0037BD05E8
MASHREGNRRVVLFGRELEQKRLAELVDGIRDRGGALLVRGEPGAGKSALVQAVRQQLGAASLRVLTAAGAEPEQHLPYAGLNQLLHPLRDATAALPATQRTALRTALGLVDGPQPEPYLVGLAVLNLLSEATTPLVLLLEDVHWFDRATQDVLAFVTRRVESEPVVVIATARDGEPTRLDDLPALALAPLDPDSAGELLDAVAPDLDPTARARIIAEAAGNPLALTELPAARTGPLDQAFAARAAELPGAARASLLIAALNDSPALAETVKAAGTDALGPAVAARLVEVDATTVTFRHALTRSAIVRAATPAELRAAHHALAATLNEPGRRAWHRAAATTGADESVAAELEAAADDARRRGGAAAAITTLEEAARLSVTDVRRADRLLRAADLAVESGRRDVVDRLLAEAAKLDLTPRQRALVTWLPTGFDDGVREGAAGATELVTLAGTVAKDGDLELAMRIFWSTAMRCFWVEPGAAARERITAIAGELPVDPADPRMVAIAAYVTPLERGAEVVTALRELADRTDADPTVVRFLGSAALQVGAFDLAARFSAAAQPGLRAEGRLGLLSRALAVQAWSHARLGDLATALPAAEEAGRLAAETHQPYVVGLARAVQAEIAALRGDSEQAEKLAVEAERVGLAAGARPVLATVQLARGLAALGAGRHADAVAALLRVFDPADPAYQLALRCYVLPELAEAAVHSDRADVVRGLVAELSDAPTTSPALHHGLRYARAVLAADEEAEDLFRTALDSAAWPLERGRLQLAFGEWLRRRRRAAESRPVLRAARETFDALGVTGWSERAARELRAAGEATPNREPDALGDLTAHELNIAQLAAEGLTNREIGQRLYLSHRTVSTHLHRIFPKLGISARGELGAALRRQS